MAIETIVQPYELLVRWDDNGLISGAHYVQMIKTVQDGQVLAVAASAPQAVTDVSGDGGLMDEILGIVQTNALAERATALSQLEIATAEKQKADEALVAAQSALSDKIAELNQVKEQAQLVAERAGKAGYLAGIEVGIEQEKKRRLAEEEAEAEAENA